MSFDRDMLDAVTPQCTTLSARYRHSLAYLSLNSRINGILLQIVDQLNDNEEKLVEQYGEAAQEDVIRISQLLMRLRSRIIRNGNFGIFNKNQPDHNEWNNCIFQLPRNKRHFYNASWMHSECYIYRRIHSYFENSKCLTKYDYYADFKQQDLRTSDSTVQALARGTRQLKRYRETFKKMARICLWSNRYDLMLQTQILPNAKVPQNVDMVSSVNRLNGNLLADHSDAIWDSLDNAMVKNNNKNVIVDFICDNAGFELFTDLLFIEYLIEAQLATMVRIHVKPIPWYLSDTTKNDVDWTLDYLRKHVNVYVREFAVSLAGLMKSGRICIAPLSYFWVGPQHYFVMADIDESLFKMLTTAKLAIFKGDVAYRKLVGDFSWNPTEEFITCLRGFRPCNICAIRTIKCEVLCGINEGVQENLLEKDSQWALSGKYGVIQYTDSFKCKCAS